MNPVVNKEELLQRLHSDASAIRSFGVSRLGLFGSFARDMATLHSDVDLLVDFAPGLKTLKNLVGLSSHLHQLLGRQVELVTPAAMNSFTGKHILQEVENVALAA